jgi:hypothetical protein
MDRFPAIDALRGAAEPERCASAVSNVWVDVDAQIPPGPPRA